MHVLFGNDPIEQGQHLMGALSRIVQSIHAPHIVTSYARELALRHVSYGVEARHYLAFATALLRTLRHERGEDFTPPVREAWAAAIKLMAEMMTEAAYGATSVQDETISPRT